MGNEGRKYNYMLRKIQPKQKAKTNDLGRFHPPSFLVDLLRCSTEAAGQEGTHPHKVAPEALHIKTVGPNRNEKNMSNKEQNGQLSILSAIK
jgi:hypothetical protein